MNPKLLKLKQQLTLSLARNDVKEIIRLRKEIIKLDDNEDIEELNTLFDG